MARTRNASYRRLEAWQLGMDLAVASYRATNDFPAREVYGLASQIRRAATSIPANVAEGYCRRSRPAYQYHVSIALGSHGELETLVELSVRLGFLTERQAADLDVLSGQTGRLLSALHKSLAARGDAPRSATLHPVVQSPQSPAPSHRSSSQSPQSPAPSPHDPC